MLDQEQIPEETKVQNVVSPDKNEYIEVRPAILEPAKIKTVQEERHIYLTGLISQVQECLSQPGEIEEQVLTQTKAIQDSIIKTHDCNLVSLSQFSIFLHSFEARHRLLQDNANRLMPPISRMMAILNHDTKITMLEVQIYMANYSVIQATQIIDMLRGIVKTALKHDDCDPDFLLRLGECLRYLDLTLKFPDLHLATEDYSEFLDSEIVSRLDELFEGKDDWYGCDERDLLLRFLLRRYIVLRPKLVLNQDVHPQIALLFGKAITYETVIHPEESGIDGLVFWHMDYKPSSVKINSDLSKLMVLLIEQEVIEQLSSERDKLANKSQEWSTFLMLRSKKRLIKEKAIVPVYNLIRNWKNEASAFSEMGLVYHIPYYSLLYFFYYLLVREMVPLYAQENIFTTIKYIETQDNILVAFFVKCTLVKVFRDVLALLLHSKLEDLEQGFAYKSATYIRSFIFYGWISGQFSKIPSHKTWSSILIDSFLFEVVAYLDALCSKLYSKQVELRGRVLKNCVNVNQDTLNDSVLPEFEVLSRDYRLVSLMSVVFSMYICILQYWYSGHATMSSITIYNIINYTASWLQLRSMWETLYELATHKRMSRSSLKLQIYFSLFRLTSVLFVGISMKVIHMTFTLRKMLSAAAMATVLACVRFSLTDMYYLISKNSQILSKFKDVPADSSQEPPECCVCLDLISQPVKTRCGHYYHWHCIVLWYLENSTLCPYCRNPL